MAINAFVKETIRQTLGLPNLHALQNNSNKYYRGGWDLKQRQLKCSGATWWNERNSASDLAL